MEQWKSSHSFIPKTNQDKVSGIDNTIRIPDDREETEEQKTMRLANSLYPTMKDKEEKPKESNPSELDALFTKKEQSKLSLEKEVPKFVDFGGGLFAEDKRPLRKNENKKEENKYFDINNKPKLNYQDEIKKTGNKKKEEPFVLKEQISKTEYTNQNDDNKKEVGKYVYSENKSYQPKHDTYRNVLIDANTYAGKKEVEGYKPLYDYSNKDTGFYGKVYINDKNKEIIIAYKGADPGSIKKDWLDNAYNMATHAKMPKQFKDAEKLYLDVKNKVGDNKNGYKIVVSGYSLGGTLAELIGAKYGDEAVTFNAYGIEQMKDAEINYRDNIINYGHKDDFAFSRKDGKHVGKTIYTVDENYNNKGILGIPHNHSLEGIGNLKRDIKKSE